MPVAIGDKLIGTYDSLANLTDAELDAYEARLHQIAEWSKVPLPEIGRRMAQICEEREWRAADTKAKTRPGRVG